MARVRGGEKIEAIIKEYAARMKPMTLRVGFLENATYPDGKSVAFVAAMNEYGHGIGANPGEGAEDTRQQVPPRPFFRNMIRAKKDTWAPAIAASLKSTHYNVEAALRRTGEKIRGQLQQSIRDLVSPPLAPSTIARKGFDKPLIDSARMLNSVDFDIKEGSPKGGKEI